MQHRPKTRLTVISAMVLAMLIGPSTAAMAAESGTAPRNGVNVEALVAIVEEATSTAKSKLKAIKTRSEAISITDMFDMRMEMNHLSQLSEMSTSVVNAANTAIQSMARNVKG
jgi:hypothetical protein